MLASKTLVFVIPKTLGCMIQFDLHVFFKCVQQRFPTYPPKNRCLEDESFPFQMVPFQGETSFIFGVVVGC